MQKIRILIVEDELLIAESLKAMLESLGYEVTGSFASGEETLKNYKLNSADVIFMDIHLADAKTGIDTAIEINKNEYVPVIYLTNNTDDELRKKAIYGANTVQYLNKPFTKTDIINAIDFALKAIKTTEFITPEKNRKAYLIDECIFLKNGLGFKKVMISDIMFLEASGSYCQFCFKPDGKTQIFSENLSYFEEKLSFARELIRVHRSYIVNVNYIERTHENRIWVSGKEISIGKTYKNILLERFRFI